MRPDGFLVRHAVPTWRCTVPRFDRRSFIATAAALTLGFAPSSFAWNCTYDGANIGSPWCNEYNNGTSCYVNSLDVFFDINVVNDLTECITPGTPPTHSGDCPVSSCSSPDTLHAEVEIRACAMYPGSYSARNVLICQTWLACDGGIAEESGSVYCQTCEVQSIAPSYPPSVCTTVPLTTHTCTPANSGKYQHVVTVQDVTGHSVSCGGGSAPFSVCTGNTSHNCNSSSPFGVAWSCCIDY